MRLYTMKTYITVSFYATCFLFSRLGHFTQLVWRSTKLFGIGKARSRSGKIVIVAHYLPAGNISGAFQYNVLPPLSCLEYNPPSAKYIVSSSSATSGSSCNTCSTWFIHYVCFYMVMMKRKWSQGVKSGQNYRNGCLKTLRSLLRCCVKVIKF